MIESPIPIIDFSLFLHGSNADKKRIAKDLDDAFQNVGFAYLRNHGVALEKVEECFQWSRKFFALPESVKMLAPHPPKGSHHRGYSGLGVEKVSQNVFDVDGIKAQRSVPDCKESFESGNIHDILQPNMWLPDGSWKDGEDFRRFMEAFFLSCSTLVHQILYAMAAALNLPSEDQLSKTHAQSLFQTRLLHYPPLSTSILRKGEKSRIGAHSDFGTLTLLFQDSVGGLEVEDSSSPGSFRPAPPIPGTVLVNIGDLMERWSNGRWRSTVHRVVAPPIDEARSKREGEDIVKARYSIPFFATADPDTVIEPLPGCSGEQNPVKFEKTTAWEYVQMRIAASY